MMTGAVMHIDGPVPIINDAIEVPDYSIMAMISL